MGEVEVYRETQADRKHALARRSRTALEAPATSKRKEPSRATRKIRTLHDDSNEAAPKQITHGEPNLHAALATGWANIARGEFERYANGHPNVSVSPNIVIKFRSPAAHRLQMRAQSTAIWFPQRLGTAGLDVAFEWMVGILSTTPALAVALDASSLVQVGVGFHDQRLLLAGKRLHCDALHLLRRELGKARPETIAGLIAAVAVLQITDFFAAMEDGALELPQHAHGMALLTKAIPTSQTNPGFRFLLDSSFHMFNFWHGLISRTAIELSRPMNAAILNSTAERVPGLLQECDELCQSATRPALSSIARLAASLDNAEQHLNEWSATWSRNVRHPPYHLVPSSKIEFIKDTERVFGFSFDFKDFVDALDFTVCTACLLAIRQARASLNACSLVINGRHNLKLSRLGHYASKDVTACADSLCMSIPYLSRVEHGNYGVCMLVGPLRVATSWYEQTAASGKAAQKLEWCYSAAAAVRERGIRTL